MSLILDEHRQYLSDSHRVEAFGQAIREVVKPGDVVVDLGSGSGIMGLLACRAGARRVYCIEDSALIGLTSEVFQANGFADRATFIQDFSANVSLPEQADVVVADQIGRFGFDAGVLEFFDDARKRFLKPGGTLVPGRIDLFVAPIERPDLFDEIEFWSGSPAGFDFSAARRIADNTGYPVTLEPKDLLSEPARLASLDAGECPQSISGLSAVLEVQRSATLHGIGGWFTAQLSANAILSNGPLADRRIQRRNVFFPIVAPVPVSAGDTVLVTMKIRPREVFVDWTVEVREKPQDQGMPGRTLARSAHSTFQGMLLSQATLRRAQPHSVPVLTARGEARRSILELCDGRRSLSEVESEVYRRHRELFAHPGLAAAFVAEVVTRYTK